jgi:hypothetical protein
VTDKKQKAQKEIAELQLEIAKENVGKEESKERQELLDQVQ